MIIRIESSPYCSLATVFDECARLEPCEIALVQDRKTGEDLFFVEPVADDNLPSQAFRPVGESDVLWRFREVVSVLGKEGYVACRGHENGRYRVAANLSLLS